jgi:hypothetical protein
MAKSPIETRFQLQLVANGITGWVREYEFAKPIRKYRADFAFPGRKLLIELNGGLHSLSGHTSAIGIQRDYDKLALATLLGFRLLYFSGSDVQCSRALQCTRAAIKDEVLSVEEISSIYGKRRRERVGRSRMGARSLRKNPGR